MERTVLILAVCVLAVMGEEKTVVSCHFFKPTGSRMLYLVDTLDIMRPEISDYTLFCKCTSEGDTSCIGEKTDWQELSADHDEEVAKAINPLVSYTSIHSTPNNRTKEVWFQCDNTDKSAVADRCRTILGKDEENEECSETKLEEKCSEK